MQLFDGDLQLLLRPTHLRFGNTDQIFRRQRVIEDLFRRERDLEALVHCSGCRGVASGVRRPQVCEPPEAVKQLETGVETAGV